MNELWQTVSLLGHAISGGRYLPYVVLAPLVLWAGVKLNMTVAAYRIPWLEWAPFHSKSNVMLAPIKYRWIWIPYTILLAAAMPFLALMEEFIFRYGTTSWLRGLLWGTLAFGALHLVSLVSVRMMLYLMLVGAILVQVYMVGGIVAVFVLHAVYNLSALAMTVATRKRTLNI
jgi:Type II CAAX prenyl endopeptidase Rce1-like